MKQRKLPTINLNQFRLSRITIHLNQTHTQGGICGTWLYYVHNILLSLSLLFHVVSLWMVWATNTECEKWWCYFNIHLWLVWQSVLWYSIVYVLTMGVLDLYWNTKGEYFHLCWWVINCPCNVLESSLQSICTLQSLRGRNLDILMILLRVKYYRIAFHWIAPSLDDLLEL